MPATAAIDNETLDHLLSVVSDGLNIEQPPRFGSAFVQHQKSKSYLPNSRIAPSRPSSVSGYMRPPMS
jgi:hypothetical protein